LRTVPPHAWLRCNGSFIPVTQVLGHFKKDSNNMTAASIRPAVNIAVAVINFRHITLLMWQEPTWGRPLN